MSVYKNILFYYLQLKLNYNLKYKMGVIYSKKFHLNYAWLSLKVIDFDIITLNYIK